MNDLDKILDFLLHYQKTKRRLWMPSVKSIQAELFPQYNEDQIISILNQIQRSRPDILTYKRTDAGDLIQITGLTEPFLAQGGFTDIELGKVVDHFKKIERDKIELEKAKIDLELAKKTLDEFPKTKWFARIGFIIGIILLLKELYVLIWV